MKALSARRERFLRETAQSAIDLEQRYYVGKVLQPLDGLRGPMIAGLRDRNLAHDPTCQAFAAERRSEGSSRLNFRSARRDGGE